MVVLTTACLMAVLLVPTHAQNLPWVVNDRVVEKGQDPPIVADAERRRGGVELAMLIAAAYDDNVFLSRNHENSDWVGRFAPTIAYSKGDPKGDAGAYVGFVYRPTAVMYAETSSENRIDHQLAATAGWRGPLSKMSYRGAFEKLGNATADTGRPTDRIEFENEIRAGWIPRDRILLEIAAGQEQSDFDDAAFYDSRRAYGEVALRYAYSPKTEISIAYQAGRTEVDGGSDQKTHQVVAGLDWRPREKIFVHLRAGAERRSTDAGTDVSPVIEGRVDWRAREGTSLFITGYQRQEASAFLAGQNYELKGFSAGIAQRLGSRWTAKLEGGRETATYSRVSGGGGSGRHDKIWFVKPSLDYRMSDALGVSLFYRVSENRSSHSNFGFEQQMAGVEMNYRF